MPEAGVPMTREEIVAVVGREFQTAFDNIAKASPDAPYLLVIGAALANVADRMVEVGGIDMTETAIKQMSDYVAAFRHAFTGPPPTQH